MGEKNMMMIKLLTILFIIQTTSAIDTNLKYEDHMCKINKTIEFNGETYIIEEEDCCDGYTPMHYYVTTCIPKCLNCSFGFCAIPDVCECYKDYQMVDNECTPICNPECVNGYCREPGICECLSGYALQATNSTYCLPKCYSKCPKFSTCMKPNDCQCNSGYKLNKLNKRCEPDCPNMPKNAECIEPANWECNHKFRHDLQINKCILNSCNCTDKGFCLEHENQCECYEGFQKNSTTGMCESVCEPQCVNSTCIANNVCQCSDGYHSTSKANICEKNTKCNNQSCENGECLSTDECQCKAGFIRSITFFEAECLPTRIFVVKLITLVVGISTLLALCILLIYYLIARKRTNAIKQHPGELVVEAINKSI